jgi:hypothetical protein
MEKALSLAIMAAIAATAAWNLTQSKSEMNLSDLTLDALINPLTMNNLNQ